MNEIEIFENFDGEGAVMDGFDTYDQYEQAQNSADIANAANRRAVGARKWAEGEEFARKVYRQAELGGKPVENVMAYMIENNPEVKNRLKAYVYALGYSPSNNPIDLMCQVADARTLQIAELQEEYSPENFDNFLSSRARRTARRERRETKFSRRKERRDLRRQVQTSRLKAKLANNQREMADAQAEPEQPEDMEQAITRAATPLRNKVPSGGYSNPLPAIVPQSVQFAEDMQPENQELEALIDPSDEMANAEIVGMEMEQADYDGYDYDNFLPFLAGAIQVGGDLVSSAKNSGADFTNFKTLFSRKPDAQTAAAAKKIPAAKLPDVLNKGIKSIVDGVEAQKKQEAIKEFLPWGIAIVIGVFLLGKYMK